MLRFETAGESHGECLVATLTGLPAGVPISLAAIDRELWRRQQGYGRGGRMKIETDKAHIVSGVRHSATIGFDGANRPKGRFPASKPTVDKAPETRGGVKVRRRRSHSDASL